MHEFDFKALGTTVTLRVPKGSVASMSQFDDVTQDVIRIFAEYESKFSRFRESSELSYINSNPGKWIAISPEFAEVMAIAKRAHRDTEGVFNPCVGRVMDEIGYDRSFDTLPTQREHRREVSSGLLTVLLPNSENLPFSLSTLGDQLYLSPGFKLDLGGIAKGWIVERAAAEVNHHGVQDFILSAGGDMVCSGRNGGSPWPIGIEDPRDHGNNLLTIDVVNGCVATSGIYRRQWRIGGEIVHHIIDPRTGRPSNSDVVSCTVIAKDLVTAEIYAKTCLILGTNVGIEWLRQREQHGWVVVKSDGEVLHAWNS